MDLRAKLVWEATKAVKANKLNKAQLETIRGLCREGPESDDKIAEFAHKFFSRVGADVKGLMPQRSALSGLESMPLEILGRLRAMLPPSDVSRLALCSRTCLAAIFPRSQMVDMLAERMWPQKKPGPPTMTSLVDNDDPDAFEVESVDLSEGDNEEETSREEEESQPERVDLERMAWLCRYHAYLFGFSSISKGSKIQINEERALALKIASLYPLPRHEILRRLMRAMVEHIMKSGTLTFRLDWFISGGENTAPNFIYGSFQDDEPEFGEDVRIALHQLNCLTTPGIYYRLHTTFRLMACLRPGAPASSSSSSSSSVYAMFAYLNRPNAFRMVRRNLASLYSTADHETVTCVEFPLSTCGKRAAKHLGKLLHGDESRFHQTGNVVSNTSAHRRGNWEMERKKEIITSVPDRYVVPNDYFEVLDQPPGTATLKYLAVFRWVAAQLEDRARASSTQELRDAKKSQ